jgi:hypothetical protein
MSIKRTVTTAARYARDRWAPEVDPDAGPVQRAAQVGTVISVVVIAVVALVGTLVLSQVYGALPKDLLYDDPTNETGATQFGNSTEAILSGVSGAMDLVPVVLLVLVASLVIGIVQRLR